MLAQRNRLRHQGHVSKRGTARAPESSEMRTQCLDIERHVFILTSAHVYIVRPYITAFNTSRFFASFSRERVK